MSIGTDVCTSRTNPIHVQPDGTVTMDYPSGSKTVASLQPDGTLSTRPEGTAGSWERATRVSGGLLFQSFGNAAKFVPFFDV